MAVEGVVVVNNASSSLLNSGSYTNDHESGKKYHGKGPQKRAEQSAERVANENNDPATNTDWTPAENDAEAFKHEAKRIENDGGVENPNNYNKINSPGKKLLEQEKKKITTTGGN